MRLCALIVLVSYLFKFSYGYSFSEIFTNISLPDRFINIIQNYARNIENEISEQCRNQLYHYGQALYDKQWWALLMFDAGAKLPSGVLSGNLVGLGNFDQCLKIEKSLSKGNTVFGKYCLGEIPLRKELQPPNSKLNVIQMPESRMINAEQSASLAFATCLPAVCSTSDIQKLYSGIAIGIEFRDYLCQSKSAQPELTNGDIATVSFLSAVFCAVILSTAYDVYLFYFQKKPVHSTLTTFSILTNVKKLLTTNSSGQISCLHGIRVISMMWIVFGHRYNIQFMFPNKNSFNLLRWITNEKNMFVMGATVSVDTFFLLGGMLVSYGFMTSAAKGLQFNIIVYYLHRYLRLTPLFAVVILIYVTILKHMGSGPLWNYAVTMLRAGCEQNWWSALLYVQNYVSVENMCVAQSWYLAVDTQLFLLSPIILILLKKMPAVGILILNVFTFASVAASFLTAWIYDLRGFMFANQNDNFMKYYYFATHTRAAPWLIGITLGYFIYEIKQKQKNIAIKKVTTLALWAASLTVLCACVFTGHNTLSSSYDRVANSFYVALLRPGWALGISWVVFACVTGYGGPVNWFLSLPMFQVISKLTYSTYLIHFAVQVIISGQMRSTPVFNNLQMFYIFWGDYAFVLATSLVFTLAFESPIVAIEKIIFGKRG